jgi:hypothetical protein
MTVDSIVLAACVPTLQRCGLLDAREVAAVAALLDPHGPFAAAVDLADTLHLHVKVDDTGALPVGAFLDAGAVLDHRRDGYVKFRFPDGLNAIFSHIAVSEEERRETADTRRPRPFLDHLGVDLRAETAAVRAVFDALPAQAARAGWGWVAQGGEGRAVFCCHVQVARKHWLYPGRDGAPAGIPIEFAYGALRIEAGRSGCDLRPAVPTEAADVGAAANCAKTPASSGAPAACGPPGCC